MGANVRIMNGVIAVIGTRKLENWMGASGSNEGIKGWSSIIDRTIRPPLSTQW